MICMLVACCGPGGQEVHVIQVDSSRTIEQIEAFPAVMMILKGTVTVAVPSSRPEAVPIVICVAGIGESTILEFGMLIERKQ